MMENGGEGEGGGRGGGRDSFFKLPEGCVADVLELTSPRDVCRLSVVASTVRRVVESDLVWERFLPADYEDILTRAILDPESPPPASKKDIFLWLSNHPLLIDLGTKSFSLEKSSGRKCYMLAARGLSIIWAAGDTPQYWRWTAAPPGCRFAEVAELVRVCWLEIRGKISTSLLSPNTTYVAFLVFKLPAGAGCFEYPPAEVAIGIGGHERETRNVYFDISRGTVPGPKGRGDGWKEVELGEYFNKGGDEGELEMSVMEVRAGHWKRGLIIQGIDIKPKVAECKGLSGTRDADVAALFDASLISFSLEESSGRKCYMLAARALSIVWGDTPQYWRWTAAPPGCRFAEVAELVEVCWLEIRGKISTSLLSPNTTYVAFLVFKLTAGAYGFGDPPAEVAIGISGHEHETQNVYLGRSLGAVPGPRGRGDGWKEVELGEYFNEGGEGELEMIVTAVRGGGWKRGLIIQGIDIRPKVDP